MCVCGGGGGGGGGEGGGGEIIPIKPRDVLDQCGLDLPYFGK